MSLDARTRKLQEDLIENNHELQARLETVESRTERETYRQPAPVQLGH
jgi:hypothetical protein